MSSLRSRSPLLLVALLATPLLLLGWHPLRSKVAAVEEGNEALAAGDAKAALEAYEQAVSEVPENL
ncbi:MAG: hypothetical protein FJ125_07115, partial [Deltaproteobacteria bacterium]|nr:hypothetical protein [Deltaproteobacteria bacterium]